MVGTTWQQHHKQRERLARLRGAKLPATSPGARGIEHVQRNPACT